MSGEAFAVSPSDVAHLPISVRTGVNVSVGSNFEVYGFYGTVVSPETWAEYGPKTSGINGDLGTPEELADFRNPYEGLPGELEQTIPAGTQFPVSYTSVATSSGVPAFAVEVPLATPTYAVRTGGTLNAVGYVFALTVQVRDAETGAIYNVQQQQMYSYFSHYSSDLQALAPTFAECEVTGSTICASTGTFGIEVTEYQTVESSTPPVVTPPVVEPPVVEPPVVVPPVVDTPSTPEHPRVNTGDGADALGWFIPVVALLGVGVFLLVARRGSRA